MRRLPLTYALLLLLSFCAVAQKARFEFFTPADGLSGNNTTSVVQDDQGFIWLINDGKLHRYDGRNFLVYPLPPEVPDGQESLQGLASSQDSLLFVWSEHFAYLFNPKTGKWRQVKLKEGTSLSDGDIFWQRLGSDNIVINSANRAFKEVSIWHFQNNRLAPVRLPKHIATLVKPFYWCDVDASGKTYLAYQDTLFQLDHSGNTKAVTPLGKLCTNCHDLCFQFGPDGTIILLAEWHFYVLDKAKNQFVPHPANRFLRSGQNHLHRFILEKNGSIWACGQDRNLIYYDALKDTLYNFQTELKKLLTNRNDFKGIFQDKTGIVWIDTRLGLLKVRPQTYPFDTYYTGLSQSNAYYSFRGITEDPQGMIYGVYYNGIAKFDPVKKQEQRLYTFKTILNFFDLYPEGENIWVNGGQLFDPKSGALKEVPGLFFENPVGDNGFFTKDKNGTLWWASHYLLYYLDRSENGFQWTKALELPERIYNKTEALHAGLQSGKLWISFKGKLLQYDPKSKKQRWFDPKGWGLPVTRITVIHEDRDGKLWLGTDAGLLHFDPADSTVRRYTVNDGLPDNFICGLLTEGDSCLWLSTNHGLSRFGIADGTFINFFEEDGLSSNEFNRKSYFKADNGRLFFGGMQGVNAFFPEALMQAYQNKEKGARMVLTAFEHTDERRDTIFRETKFAVQPEIRLHHWDWSYTFEYVLTDYSNPKEILYSYKMDGYKDGWSAPSKFNFTRFNSLPAGEYVFRVKARDSHGRWHPNELAVRVVVYPPWWATWWAYLLYGVALAALVYFLLRYELNRQRLRYSLGLEKLEAERLKDLDSFKSRLYTNLTHEFRTPLTVIIGMAGQLRDTQAGRLIEDNGKNLQRLISQLLDLSKLESKAFQLHPRQGDIVPYLRYVTESFQSFANGKNLSLRFYSPAESFVMDFDPEQIKQVLVNLISNALKFTPSGGDVTVRLVPQTDQLDIEVQDTGIGIGEANLPHVFDRFYQVDSSTTRAEEGTGIGLAHASELVKLMEGDLSVKSKSGQGSTFIVRLPVKREAPPLEEVPGQAETPDWLPAAAATETSDAEDAGTTSSLPLLLLIEDNPDVVTYLKSILGGLFRLDVAYNGEIGIEKALEEVPDLIISDVMMPGKDGFEVCDTLKNDQRTSHIPLVLLTAKADAASRLAGLRRGADAYLAKPFDKEELLVRLQMLLERQKRMAAWFSSKLQEATPDAQLEEAIQVEDAFIQKLRQIVEENFADEDFALPQLCKEVGMSRSQLFRKMQAVSNTPPSDFIRIHRLQRAKELLETGQYNISEVAWKVGFKTLPHFSKNFHDYYGYPPSKILK